MTYSVPKRANRFEYVCRNGHARTPENTYVRSDGGRQCMECPSWQGRNLSTRQRQVLQRGEELSRRTKPGPDHYDRVLSASELAYLRSLIPCVVCAEVQNAEGFTVHRPGCWVPLNVEDDGTAEPSRKTKRVA